MVPTHDVRSTASRYSLLFLTFSALVANPKKKLLYTVANPARGLLNREKKKKKKSGSAPLPPPPRALLVRTECVKGGGGIVSLVVEGMFPIFCSSFPSVRESQKCVVAQHDM